MSINKNAPLTISLIIITGLIVFGGSFLVAMYFMEPKVSQDSPQGTAQPHLGLCEGEKVYTSFAEALRNPEDVCSLQIGEGNLTEIPRDISKLKNLTYLSIIRNDITTIPAEIGELNNLVTLYLNFNQISTVPDELGKLNKLQKLQMVSNPLSASEKAKVKQLLPNVEIRL